MRIFNTMIATSSNAASGMLLKWDMINASLQLEKAGWCCTQFTTTTAHLGEFNCCFPNAAALTTLRWL